jgi:hypothetical protein
LNFPGKTGEDSQVSRNLNKFNIFLTVIITILLSGCSSIVVSQENTRGLLLRGATIIDGVSDEPLTGYSVYIEGNLVREIRPANTPVPPNTDVIDLGGKYIIPGMIEAHVHWLDWMGELFLNHGVTSVIAMDDINADFRLKSHTDDSRLPRVYHTAGNISLTNNDSEEKIRESVKQYLAKKPDMARFPTYNEHSSRVFALAAKEIHDAGYLIFGHAENADLSIKAGHDVVEHVWGFAQATMTNAELEAFRRGEYLTWATFMTGRWEQLDRMIEDAVAAGAYLNPTLVYEWGGMSERALERELEEYRVLSHPRLVYYPKNLADSLLAKHRQIKNFSDRYENTPYVSLLPANDREEFAEGYQNVLEFIRRYVAAGGKIEAGTDTISGGMPGLVLHQEMQMLVEAGITPMQALKSATRWSAELLEGKNGALGPASVGSIQPGKYADLVVLGDNPLMDIVNTQNIERVMKNGQWVEFGYTPDYYSFTSPSRSIAGATFAPIISSISPESVTAGSSEVRVALVGSGFQQTTLVRVNGISVKTDFINPRRIEFTIPADLVARPFPNPYSAPGPLQNVGVVGYRSVGVHAFTPPPEGGISNTVHLMVRPDWVE